MRRGLLFVTAANGGKNTIEETGSPLGSDDWESSNNKARFVETWVVIRIGGGIHGDEKQDQRMQLGKGYEQFYAQKKRKNNKNQVVTAEKHL